MNFKFGLPQVPNHKSEKENDWHPFGSVNQKKIFFYGLLLGVVLTLCFDFFIKNFTLCSHFEFKVFNKFYLIFLILFLHEFFHAIFYPNFANLNIGFSLKKGILYVSSPDSISKKRMLIIGISPFLFLTLIPIILLFYTNNEYLAYIALYNTIGSGIDLIVFFKILNKPKNMIFKDVGFELFYKQN